MKIFLMITLIFILVFIVALWFNSPSMEELRYQVEKREQYAPVFYDRYGYKISSYFTSCNQTEYISIDSIPLYFIDLLIFYEDKRFLYHIGFDPIGIVRAFLNYIWYGEARGGASTIPQQTFRLVTGWTEKSILRKLIEIMGSIKMSVIYNKKRILEEYINRVPFGGPRNGIYAASIRYFNKHPQYLTRAESIMLISFLNKQPVNIFKNTEQAYEKYTKRVEMLKRSKKISNNDSDYLEIINGPQFNFGKVSETSYWIFLDRVFEELSALKSDLCLKSYDLEVETTLDKKLNDSICSTIVSEMKKLPKGIKVAFILLNNENEIIAYTNGSTLRSQFDFLTSKSSMPASRFKVFVTAVAVEKMLEEGKTPIEILNYKLPTRYRLKNGEMKFDSNPDSISLREAIASSRNAALYHLGNKIITPKEITEMAQYFDLYLPQYESLCMGTENVNELQLATIYSTLLVRNGFLKSPSFIRRILSNNGILLYDSKKFNQSECKVFSSTTCKIMRQLLREASQFGTSKYLSTIESIQDYDIGVKTGTMPLRKFRQVGVTGTFNGYTFSLLIQGDKQNFTQTSSQIAVPLVASILQCIQRNGYF